MSYTNYWEQWITGITSRRIGFETLSTDTDIKLERYDQVSDASIRAWTVVMDGLEKDEMFEIMRVIRDFDGPCTPQGLSPRHEWLLTSGSASSGQAIINLQHTGWAKAGDQILFVISGTSYWHTILSVGSSSLTLTTNLITTVPDGTTVKVFIRVRMGDVRVRADRVGKNVFKMQILFEEALVFNGDGVL